MGTRSRGAERRRRAHERTIDAAGQQCGHVLQAKRRLTSFTRRVLVVLGVTILGVGLTITPAIALEEEVQHPVAQILRGVPAEFRVLQDEASLRHSDDFDIPDDPSEGVILMDEAGKHLRIGLPFDEQARDGVAVGPGSVVYDNQNGSSTVPIGKSDGSVQISTVIESGEAPSAYEYVIDVDGLSRIELNEDGSVAFIGDDGSYLGGASAPWAVDANGRDVPSRYDVVGSKLIQRVDHSASRHLYPVVADPWLGIDLYTTPYVTFPSGGYKINVSPTSWGQTSSGASIWWAHRDEVVSKLGGSSWRWTDSIQEQFYCHIAGLPASLPEYNLESWRPLMNWAAQAPYKCNYPEGWFSG